VFAAIFAFSGKRQETRGKRHRRRNLISQYDRLHVLFVGIRQLKSLNFFSFDPVPDICFDLHFYFIPIIGRFASQSPEVRSIGQATKSGQTGFGFA
jgi:hypothetical protein